MIDEFKQIYLYSITASKVEVKKRLNLSNVYFMMVICDYYRVFELSPERTTQLR